MPKYVLKWKAVFVVLIGCFLFSSKAISAKPEIEYLEKIHGDVKILTVKNPYYVAKLKPDSGGNIYSLVIKSTGHNVTTFWPLQEGEKIGGIGTDGSVPGALAQAEYKYRILEKTNKKISIMLWTRGKYDINP